MVIHQEATTYLDCGSIKYKVEAFYMKNLDGYSKLHNIPIKTNV